MIPFANCMPHFSECVIPVHSSSYGLHRAIESVLGESHGWLIALNRAGSAHGEGEWRFQVFIFVPIYLQGMRPLPPSWLEHKREPQKTVG